jgi:phage baseplate assembly protein W
MANRSRILGRGFSFPFHFDPATGGVALSSDEENIRENITILLSTRPGERQMLPGYGCRVHELLFAPHTSATSTQAAAYVEEAITRWEPRVKVLHVDARSSANGTLALRVEYKIVATDRTEVLTQDVTPSG